MLISLTLTWLYQHRIHESGNGQHFEYGSAVLWWIQIISNKFGGWNNLFTDEQSKQLGNSFDRQLTSKLIELRDLGIGWAAGRRRETHSWLTPRTCHSGEQHLRDPQLSVCNLNSTLLSSVSPDIFQPKTGDKSRDLKKFN